ncbi:endopeptidase La [Candidatus Shapirobacteria bacterium]|nr:endopeptidase La [Candidatus Shapirobacteria bacterium]
MPILLGPSKVEKTLPVVALRESVIFPHIEVPLTLGRPKSNAAVKASFLADKNVVLFTQKDSSVEDPGKDDLYSVGTLCALDSILETDGSIYAWVRGIARVRFEEVVSTQPFLVAKVSQIEETGEENDEAKALVNYLLDQFRRALNLGKSVERNMGILRVFAESARPGEIADQLASTLDLKTEERQALLEMPSMRDRLERVTWFLNREIKILELEQSIHQKTQAKFEKGAMESFLRERKKTIEKELKELGSEEEEDSETKKMADKIKSVNMPPLALKKAKEELDRLKKMSVYNPEAGYIRTYLEWLTAMPWSKKTANNVSLKRAEKTLDEDHWGLEKIKERIIEYLAVMHLRKNQKAKIKDQKEETGGLVPPKPSKSEGEGGPTILCFIGPPGVGKTSIGKSVARALGRKFIRISLGGIRDEAEIRGHRRTYVGALPGRIIQAVKTADSKNPVFMLDEIDKIGADFRGDPSAALLEALDPEQNKEFSDHYLEVPFDLSGVFFITTGNVLDSIPPALRDRMEVIRFPGYTEEEKFHIAKDFLWPKQVGSHGLAGNHLKLSEPAIYEIIRRYTREAGVRDLERNLANICRKVARKVAEKKEYPQSLATSDVRKFLGPLRFSATIAEKKDEVGLATGLAWTEAGGDILFIEVALMPGKGTLMLTGQLGDVMKESCQAAMSYVRAHWKELGLKEGFAKKLDTHIHVPEGAIPKDGPSAGVAIATAIVSALTKRPVRRAVGMTGEVTLRGRVLEIGGVKEKVIAAHRAGLKYIILPKDNRKDLEDIPNTVKKEIKFIFVAHLDEVLKSALRNS